MSEIEIKKNKNEMDMTSGPLLKKIILFSIPLILTGVLQLLYNAMDIIVVGQFAGSIALAAVGSTGPIINLLTNVFMGLSIGASVVVAQYYGAQQFDDTRKTVHCSMLVSAICGVILAVIGYFSAEQLLLWMDTPADVINDASLYMRIFFIGMPANMVYNFGSSILRAVGDTKRPLYYLTATGIVNVIMNLIFVLCFKMGVDGVAWATVIAQYLSMLLILLNMIKNEGVVHLDFKELKIYKDKLIQITKIGLPAGIQGSIFSISNVLIQSGINSFGSVAMAGSAAAGNIEGFVYISMNSIHQTAMTFTGQNVGAEKFNRIKKILWICIGFVVVVGEVMGVIAYLCGAQLLGLYTADPMVIEQGMARMLCICVPYGLLGAMEVFVGVIRGMGYSITPMVTSIIGVCVLRVVWIYTVFEWSRTLLTLYISYPVSWVITIIAHFISYKIIIKRVTKGRICKA